MNWPRGIGNRRRAKRDDVVSRVWACDGAVIIAVAVSVGEWASSLKVLRVRCRLAILPWFEVTGATVFICFWFFARATASDWLYPVVFHEITWTSLGQVNPTTGAETCRATLWRDNHYGKVVTVCKTDVVAVGSTVIDSKVDIGHRRPAIWAGTFDFVWFAVTGFAREVSTWLVWAEGPTRDKTEPWRWRL